MKRRDFIQYALPATGAVILVPGFINHQAFAEINRQFSGGIDFRKYDVVINGAGLSGYFAAIDAARKGLKVLITDKRTSPGFEITAKQHLWIDSEGLSDWDTDFINLFFPEQELQEISKKGGNGPNNSLFGDELLLLAGTIKKGMLRNLLVNRVHVLLMTDICGVFSDDNKCVNGVLLATKQGLFAVKGKNFIDASDNLIFSRELLDHKFSITTAGFVLELLNVKNPEKKLIKVSPELGIHNDQVIFHPGKNADHQMFLEFEFPATNLGPEDIEYRARTVAAKIGKNLKNIDDSLREAKIHNYALESSVYLYDTALPMANLKGHYMLPGANRDLTCRKIYELQRSASKLLEKLDFEHTHREPQFLTIQGAKIPFENVTLKDANEPGLAIPLKKCEFSAKDHIKNVGRCDVLVGGGGTAGAAAGIGALKKGADTLVVDYFNDPGGTKTMGGVMGYYHGIKGTRFIGELENESSQLTTELNVTKRTGRRIYLSEHLSKAKGRFLPGAVICGAMVNNKKVEGIIVCINGKLSVILGKITIDATGDGDIAIFAGAGCGHGEMRAGITQNYSQWNIVGGSKPPSYPSSDYDLIDNTKITELQRGLFLSHYEAHFYDFYPYLTVRESRRIKGLYELNLIDAVEETHFDDMISAASSDYDPHYVGNSEFTRCGFLLPHSNVVKIEIPYRSVIPEGLDGILISGKAFSQTHNALQFTRMSGDITILGYLTGQIAADLATRQIQPKDYDVSDLQQEWFKNGYLPAEYANKKPGNRINDPDEIKRRISNLAEGKQEYLYECCRLPERKALPVLKMNYKKLSNPEGKLLIAKALAWFGESLGNDLIAKELEELFAQEQLQGYPGGYIENYDFIRGREKNVLEGLFWRINQDIALLGMAGNTDNNNTISDILENTGSGGGMISWTGTRGNYFNSRIDLRLIPFYNRIFNLCFYVERVPGETFIRGFEKLLKDDNIHGFMTEEYHLTRWRVYGGNLELNIGSAMARCGSKKGYDILLNYLDDIHYNFKYFAAQQLKSLTNVDHGFNRDKWKIYLSGLIYPQPCNKLVKEKEL